MNEIDTQKKEQLDRSRREREYDRSFTPRGRPIDQQRQEQLSPGLKKSGSDSNFQMTDAVGLRSLPFALGALA